MDEAFLIQLRDCFTAGYTMPQFCVDNDIKKPLFVGLDERHRDFLWNVYVQFKYDKFSTVIPQFALLNGKISDVYFSTNGIVNKLQIKNLSEFDLNDFDRIITLFSGRFQQKIDNVTYLNEMTGFFMIRTYVDIPLSNFLKRFPDVKLVILTSPHITENKNNTDRENQLLKEADPAFLAKLRNRIKNSDGKKIFTPYDFLGYSNEEVCKLLEVVKQTVNPDGSSSLEDNEFLGIKNGRRMTAYQPENYANKIYFVGNCNYYGYGVPYEKTVESLLQKMLNEKNLPYRVENYSSFTWTRYQDIFYNLNALSPKKNDIIFVCLENFKSNVIPHVDANIFFARPHNYGEVFADAGHVNELGHRVLADYIFAVLTQNNFFKDLDFNYPPVPPPSFIATEYLQKVHIPCKIFLKTKSWKNTRRNFAKKDFKSARLS